MIKKLITSIFPICWMLNLKKELMMVRHQLDIQTRIQQNLYKQVLKVHNLNTKQTFPSFNEHQTFSQNGEDGILAEILSIVGEESKYFIEIGSGDGLENNTRLLLNLGWTGFWIDGDKNNCQIAKKENESFFKTGALTIVNSIVTTQNVNKLLSKVNDSSTIDVLSIDLDLNTYHIWKTIEEISARIVILEYNGFFPSNCEWVSDYDPKGWWKGGINMGASLASITKLSKQKGYRLIGCDLSGTNAFFVREDLAVEHFPKSGNPDLHFEPARPFLLNNPEHRIDLS